MARKNPVITVNQLREMMDYHPDGRLFWKIQRGKMPPGTQVGTPAPDGRRQTQILGVRKNVSHVVWFYHYGVWPNERYVIDHINRNPSDDRVENLRIASYSLNRINQKARETKGPLHLVLLGREPIYLGDFFPREMEAVKRGAIAMLYHLEKEHL